MFTQNVKTVCFGKTKMLTSATTYHNDASRLLYGAHAHYRCHANGSTLEIDTTGGRRERKLEQNFKFQILI